MSMSNTEKVVKDIRRKTRRKFSYVVVNKADLFVFKSTYIT